MPRRPLPNCAFCGEPLRRRANIRYHWDMLPGRPEIGWHADDDPNCWDQDTRARTVGGRAARLAAAAEIEARGPGRVVRSAAARRSVPPVAVPVAG